MLPTHSRFNAAELKAANAILSFSGEFEFLSNFHHSWLTYDDIRFKTAEHAFVYAKLRSFGALKVNRKEQKFRVVYDGENLTTITYDEFNSLHPGAAKRIGREVPPSTPDHLKQWDDGAKFDAMKAIVKAKFTDQALRNRLLATGDRMLVEGNTWGDRIWGAVSNGTHYIGDNRLGRILMKRRAKTRG